jgi:monovalent cation:H+ antiporter-2, CPA2 family
MAEAWGLLAEIVSLLAAAFVLGIAAQRLRQDVIIGYLLAGLLLGPYALKLVHSVEAVEVLAELGVALLLFSIGLEFSLSKLRRLGRLALVGGGLQITLSILFIIPAALLFHLELQTAAVVGMALALSSTAVVLRLLQSRSEMESPHGRGALGILLMQDVALVPLLILFAVLAEGRRGMAALADLSFALGKAVALVAVLFVFLRYVFPKLFRDASLQSLREVPVVLAMATCLGSTWGAHALGLSPALGAFAGGVLLGDLPYAHQIRADAVPLRAIFVTVFFASIGMLAVPPELSDVPLVLMLTLLVLALKTMAATFALRAFRLPAQVAVHTGVLLSQVGEFSFVLLSEAGGKGLLPPAVVSHLVSVSVLTLLVTPHLFRLAPWMASHFGMTPETQTPALQSRERRVIVAGYGPSGQQVVAALEERGFHPYVLELNPNSAGGIIHFGDASRPEILEHAGIHEALAFVVTVPDPQMAQTMVACARRLAPDVPVIARSRYHRFLPDLLAAGATLAVDEESSVGRLLAAQVLKSLPRHEAAEA